MNVEKLCRPLPLLRASGLRAISLLFVGCQTIEEGVSIPTSLAALSGTVHGGKSPISGSTIQLYVAGSAGDGSLAQPLLSKTIQTNSEGAFSMDGKYTCPSADAEVYIVHSSPRISIGYRNQSFV